MRQCETKRGNVASGTGRETRPLQTVAVIYRDHRLPSANSTDGKSRTRRRGARNYIGRGVAYYTEGSGLFYGAVWLIIRRGVAYYTEGCGLLYGGVWLIIQSGVAYYTEICGQSQLITDTDMVSLRAAGSVTNRWTRLRIKPSWIKPFTWRALYGRVLSGTLCNTFVLCVKLTEICTERKRAVTSRSARAAISAAILERQNQIRFLVDNQSNLLGHTGVPFSLPSQASSSLPFPIPHHYSQHNRIA